MLAELRPDGTELLRGTCKLEIVHIDGQEAALGAVEVQTLPSLDWLEAAPSDCSVAMLLPIQPSQGVTVEITDQSDAGTSILGPTGGPLIPWDLYPCLCVPFEVREHGLSIRLLCVGVLTGEARKTRDRIQEFGADHMARGSALFLENSGEAILVTHIVALEDNTAFKHMELFGEFRMFKVAKWKQATKVDGFTRPGSSIRHSSVFLHTRHISKL